MTGRRAAFSLILHTPLVASCSAPAVAQQAFAGTWKIARFVIAPWADASKVASSDSDTKHLMGKTITFAAKAVTGPSPYACKNPRYDIRKADGPDMLFQGT